MTTRLISSPEYLEAVPAVVRVESNEVSVEGNIGIDASAPNPSANNVSLQRRAWFSIPISFASHSPSFLLLMIV